MGVLREPYRLDGLLVSGKEAGALLLPRLDP